MIVASSGPPVVFGAHLGQDQSGDQAPMAPAGGDLGTALGGLKWLAIAVGVWFFWKAFKGAR